MDVKIVGDDPLGYKKVSMNCDHRLDTDALRFPLAMQSFVSGFNLLTARAPTTPQKKGKFRGTQN